PSRSVLPTTWPPLMPPPISTVLHAFAQWLRPPPPHWGERPNSPIHTTSVVSSSPRVLRSSTRADIAVSHSRERALVRGKLSRCVSHATACPITTSTNGTPASTSRRAIRHPDPKPPDPVENAFSPRR